MDITYKTTSGDPKMTTKHWIQISTIKKLREQNNFLNEIWKKIEKRLNKKKLEEIRENMEKMPNSKKKAI